MTTEPEGPACRAVSQLWDSVVDDFLASRETRASLMPWANSYRGKGEGAVDWDALPELFLGPLTKPRGVFLALNPGQAYPCFHGLDGFFAREIREKYGSYTAWAASWPYFRDPWVARKEENQHHKRRLRFLRDWLDDGELIDSDMVSFELYPWHSPRLKGQLRKGGEDVQELIQEFVWKPVKELGAPVFAFGTPWFSFLKNPVLGLDVVKKLGANGKRYGSRVESRSVLVLRDSDGLTVIAAKHLGGAGPPSHEETICLREAFDRFCC